MIESCSPKRMLISIVILGGLTLFVLILESYLTEEDRNIARLVDAENFTKEYCWLTEDFDILEPCHPCSVFNGLFRMQGLQNGPMKTDDARLRNLCNKVTWIEEKKFWTFQFVMIILTIVSSCMVFFRQKVLDRKIVRRIQRQLANYP